MNANPYALHINERFDDLNVANSIRNEIRNRVIEFSRSADGLSSPMQTCAIDKIVLACDLNENVLDILSYFIDDVHSGTTSAEDIPSLVVLAGQKVNQFNSTSTLAEQSDNSVFARDVRAAQAYRQDIQQLVQPIDQEESRPDRVIPTIRDVMEGKYAQETAAQRTAGLRLTEAVFAQDFIIFPSRNTSAWKSVSTLEDAVSHTRSVLNEGDEEGESDSEEEETDVEENLQRLFQSLNRLSQSGQPTSEPALQTTIPELNHKLCTLHAPGKDATYLASGGHALLQRVMWVALSQLCASCNTTPPAFETSPSTVQQQDQIIVEWLRQVADMTRYDIQTVVFISETITRYYGGVCSCATNNRCVAAFVKEKGKYHAVSFKFARDGQHTFVLVNEQANDAIGFFEKTARVRASRTTPVSGSSSA